MGDLLMAQLAGAEMISADVVASGIGRLSSF